MENGEFVDHFERTFPGFVGRPVLVALSGGRDSVALLHLLRNPRLDLRLEAAHVHHGLRGAEADSDAEFCRRLCAALEIPFELIHLPDDDERPATGEAAWRRRRYRVLLECAASRGLAAIATGREVGYFRGRRRGGFEPAPAMRLRLKRDVVLVALGDLDAAAGTEIALIGPSSVFVYRHSLAEERQRYRRLFRERGFFATVDHSIVGPIGYPSFPMRFSGHYLPVDRPSHLLGEHNDEVLREKLGLSDEELAKLRSDKVIGERPTFM